VQDLHGVAGKRTFTLPDGPSILQEPSSIDTVRPAPVIEYAIWPSASARNVRVRLGRLLPKPSPTHPSLGEGSSVPRNARRRSWPPSKRKTSGRSKEQPGASGR